MQWKRGVKFNYTCDLCCSEHDIIAIGQTGQILQQLGLFDSWVYDTCTNPNRCLVITRLHMQGYRKHGTNQTSIATSKWARLCRADLLGGYWRQQCDCVASARRTRQNLHCGAAWINRPAAWRSWKSRWWWSQYLQGKLLNSSDFSWKLSISRSLPCNIPACNFRWSNLSQEQL